jgi:hypothetical protein
LLKHDHPVLGKPYFLRRNIVTASHDVSSGVEFPFLVDPRVVAVNIATLAVTDGMLGKANVHSRATYVLEIVQGGKTVTKPMGLAFQ